MTKFVSEASSPLSLPEIPHTLRAGMLPGIIGAMIVFTTPVLVYMSIFFLLFTVYRDGLIKAFVHEQTLTPLAYAVATIHQVLHLSSIWCAIAAAVFLASALYFGRMRRLDRR